MKDALRQAVRVVALLNLAYFGVEFSVALLIGSVSLFADSIDFLEDAAINILIGMGLAWSTPRRALIGKMLASIILVPGLATLWMACRSSEPRCRLRRLRSHSRGLVHCLSMSCAP